MTVGRSIAPRATLHQYDAPLRCVDEGFRTHKMEEATSVLVVCCSVYEYYCTFTTQTNQMRFLIVNVVHCRIAVTYINDNRSIAPGLADRVVRTGSVHRHWTVTELFRACFMLGFMSPCECLLTIILDISMFTSSRNKYTQSTFTRRVCKDPG